MKNLDCGHAAPAVGRWCKHLLADEDASFIVRFTGQGVDHELRCEACDKDAAGAREPVAICSACHHTKMGRVFDLMAIRGRPEIRTRETALRFEHRELRLPALAGRTLKALTALGSAPRVEWLAVDERGELLRLDLEEDTVSRVGAVSAESLDLTAELALHASACGRYAAVVNSRGSRGVVVELASGAVKLALDRGDYHVEHCEFSVAFFRDGDRTLVVHATAWNRLDVTDPATGELLTRREPHELDYFHCGLKVSPDGAWLVDDGWVWHPVGMLSSLSLRRWLHENVWESEDGPSRKLLRECAYYWDAPSYFVGPRTLVTWGFGGDAEHLIDAAMLYDVESGNLLRWFPGPRGQFHGDGNLLLATSQEQGTCVWDIETGERLHQDAALKPTAWHPSARRFLTVLPEGVVRESVLSGAAW
ncbi:hypothetical protein [Myxococcus landrumensis]|uniref:WD40 repeat domain-containing protein n=1 Tax=Myxococcus landrumensis TaxID=2813577 RepID=A0ABX7NH25_9BACT|nr:hypothetical protein [Myxococcus landrumus]QSQ17698.1 hypothetical protein JY572_17405 [Myxococcus landrumus]